jgi:hypothetical protein
MVSRHAPQLVGAGVALFQLHYIVMQIGSFSFLHLAFAARLGGGGPVPLDHGLPIFVVVAVFDG